LAVPEWDEFGDLELLDEKKVPLGKLFTAVGDSLVYAYDFGDDWRHEVVLEQIEVSEGSTMPVCLGTAVARNSDSEADDSDHS
jgi:hypothetical protein